METTALGKILPVFGDYMVNDLGHTEETRVGYLGNLKRIFEKLNLKTLEDLQKEDIDRRWMSYFWEQMNAGQALGDQTRRRYLSALKKFLRFLEDDNLMPKGKADSIKLPRAELRHYEGLNPEEQSRLKTYLYQNLGTDVDRRNAALIMFLWATGCRISEALKVDCAADSKVYVNPIKHSGDFSVHVNVRKQWMVYVHINGKWKRNRRIPVANDVVAMLNFYLDRRDKKNEIMFQNHAWARNKYGERLTKSGADRIVRKVFEKAGLEKRKEQSTHIFRHTFIDKLVVDGVSPIEIATMVGMADVKSLEPYYNRSKDLTFAIGGDLNPFKNVKPIEEAAKNIEELQSMLDDRFLQAAF